MCLSLEQAGASEVICSRNGAAAIQSLERGARVGRLPGLVVVDRLMPGGSGCEVVRWIRSQPAFRGARVVMLSGEDGGAAERVALEAGADGFEVKPARFIELVGLAARLLAGQHRIRDAA